ncbi:AraC family transcriptional regulator [Kitasatospora acidiphila]|nr:AraC family transcriptional regulator [Kitasatospora acidiphila]
MSVTAVAHALGFSSSQRFATIFRRYQGVSPTGARTAPDAPVNSA